MKKIGLGARSIILLCRSVTSNFIGEDLEFFTGGMPIIFMKKIILHEKENKTEAFSAFAGRKPKSPNDFLLIFFSSSIGESNGLKESIRDKLASYHPHPPSPS